MSFPGGVEERVLQKKRTRRRLSHQDRREELVTAAMRILRGDIIVEKANWVALVTEEAGAAKGTFYRYFPSWEDMLATVRDRLMDEFHAPVFAELQSSTEPDWWNVIVGQCGRLVDVALEYRARHGLIFHAPLPGTPVDAMSTGSTVLALAIRRGVAAGQFPPVNEPEITATLLFTGMHAVADAVLVGEERTRWQTIWAEQAAAVLCPDRDPASFKRGEKA